MPKIGDKIKITNMRGEPDYTNREGIITLIERDAYGEMYFRGTWGGLSVYDGIDEYIIID